jgi:hypothetical protein
MSRHPTHSVEPGSVAQPHTRQLEKPDASSRDEPMALILAEASSKDRARPAAGRRARIG